MQNISGGGDMLILSIASGLLALFLLAVGPRMILSSIADLKNRDSNIKLQGVLAFSAGNLMILGSGLLFLLVFHGLKII